MALQLNHIGEFWLCCFVFRPLYSFIGSKVDIYVLGEGIQYDHAEFGGTLQEIAVTSV